MGNFEIAFSDLIKTPSSPGAREGAADAINAIHDFQRALAETEMKRPFYRWLQQFRTVADSLAAAAEATLDAFSSGSIDKASEVARVAQGRVDQAAMAIETLDRFENAAALIGSTLTEDPMVCVLRALNFQNPGLSAFELDELGRNQATRLIGSDTFAGEGVSFLTIVDLLSNSYFNPDRISSVIRSSSAICMKSAHVAEVAHEPNALKDLADAKILLYDAFKVLDQTLTPEVTDEEAVRRLLRLYADVFENAGLPIFAWYLKLSGEKQAAYARLRETDATELSTKVLGSSVIAKLFLGANKHLRTATNHGRSYSVAGEDVVFALRSFRGTITLEDLLDETLALCESLLATTWSLDNALTKHGFSDHVPTDVSLFGINPGTIAALALEQIGMSVQSTAFGSGSWSFVVDSNGLACDVWFRGVVSHLAPDQIQKVEFIDKSQPNGHVQVRVQRVSPSQDRETAGNPIELLRTTIADLHNAKHDGRSALTTEHIQYAAAAGILSLLQEQTIEAIPLMRDLLTHARVAQLTEVVIALEDAFREFRSAGRSSNSSIGQRVVGWMNVSFPKIPDAHIWTIVPD